ncbi:hypothetical protein [Seonamhaeicola sp.]|uniref:hypothetical protein n=1 Tax=Seonamhaeicola sp. TaxID=1912245 RepID=UPI0026347912|nr:hypothetical protein [Seonamhaeicola sp.]
MNSKNEESGQRGEIREAIKGFKARISEQEQEKLVHAFDFINQFKTDLEEIEFLQDKQRHIRLIELKNDLVEQLIRSSIYVVFLDKEYREIVYSEIKSIYNLE